MNGVHVIHREWHHAGPEDLGKSPFPYSTSEAVTTSPREVEAMWVRHLGKIRKESQ